MNDTIQNTIAEVFAIEDSGAQVKLRDKAKRSLGSFFKAKKDGNQSQAYQQYQNMEVKSGDTIEISFVERPYKDGTIKNIIGFREAAGRPVQNTVKPPLQAAQTDNKVSYAPAEQPKDDKFWDKKAYKQCLWNYWLENKSGNPEDWGLNAKEIDRVWLIFNVIEQDADKRFDGEKIAPDESFEDGSPIPNIPF